VIVVSVPSDVKRLYIILSCDLYVFNIKVLLSRSNARACYLVNSKDSSRKLQVNYAIIYFFYLYLMLYACVIKFNVIRNFEKFLDFE